MKPLEKSISGTLSAARLELKELEVKKLVWVRSSPDPRANDGERAAHWRNVRGGASEVASTGKRQAFESDKINYGKVQDGEIQQMRLGMRGKPPQGVDSNEWLAARAAIGAEAKKRNLPLPREKTRTRAKRQVRADQRGAQVVDTQTIPVANQVAPKVGNVQAPAEPPKPATPKRKAPKAKAKAKPAKNPNQKEISELRRKTVEDFDALNTMGGQILRAEQRGDDERVEILEARIAARKAAMDQRFEEIDRLKAATPVKPKTAPKKRKAPAKKKTPAKPKFEGLSETVAAAIKRIRGSKDIKSKHGDVRKAPTKASASGAKAIKALSSPVIKNSLHRNHAAAWDGASPDAIEALSRVHSRALVDAKGGPSYFDSNKGVVANLPRDRQTPSQIKATEDIYRHEMGHNIDVIGRADKDNPDADTMKNAGLRMKSSSAWRTAGNDLNKAEENTSQESSDNAGDIKSFTDKYGIDPRLLTDEGSQDYEAADLALAIEEGDIQQIDDLIGIQHLPHIGGKQPEDWDEADSTRHLVNDLLQGLSQGRYGEGHTDAYYAQFNTVNGGYTEGHLSEAFANWYALYTKGPAWREFLTKIMPETDVRFKDILKGKVDIRER